MFAIAEVSLNPVDSVRLVLAALCVAVALGAFARPSAASGDDVVVESEVYEELASSPRVDVIVVLSTPGPVPADLAMRSAEVAALVDTVLAGIPQSEVEVRARWEAVGAFAARVTLEGVRLLSHMEGVKKVVLDVPGGGGLTESVPLINADVVGAMGYGGEGVVVAVLDTGVDASHPDLEGDVIDEHCFCVSEGGGGCCPGGATEAGGPGSAMDDNGHGTNIAGIITSDGLVAPPGVAPGAKIVAVKVLDKDNRFSSLAQVVSGLNWVIVNHPEVDVINMSLGTDRLFSGPCDGDGLGLVFADPVATLKARGVLVVASTQNDGSPTQIAAPACLSSTVAVSAVYDSSFGPSFVFDCLDLTAADVVPCFANNNPFVDLLAPGAKIVSSGPGGGLLAQSGTSQAAAHVSASAAVLMGAAPELGADGVLAVLKETGVPVTDARNGVTLPRINLLAALNAAVPVSGEDCTDLADNDGNGLIDCEDPACDGKPSSEGAPCEFGVETSCTDGADNDADGAVDAADPDCERSEGAGDSVPVSCSLTGVPSARGRWGAASAALPIVPLLLLPLLAARFRRSR